MRKTKMLLTALTVLLCLFESSAIASMSSASFSIPTAVISGGGSFMSSASFSMVSTLGQPSTLGSGSSTNYSIEPGFLSTLLIAIAVGDVNGDGAVNLKDVIAALQIVTGQSPAAVKKEADADGDGKIGLGEALHLIRMLSE